MSGLIPPLKYGPTGVTKRRKIYSGAGATPITGPEPKRHGRTYSVAPVPYGGTHAAFAFTVSSRARRNISVDTSGIMRRRAEFCILSALSSGRNVTMLPSFHVYALRPSKHVCAYCITPAHSEMVILSSVVRAPSFHLPSFQSAWKR